MLSIKRQISIHELAEAIRKNGLPQSFHSLYHFNYDAQYANDPVIQFPKSVIEACAMGQAQINLRAEFVFEGNTDTVLNDIVNWNDNEELSLAEIADKVEEKYPDEFVWIEDWGDRYAV